MNMEFKRPQFKVPRFLEEEIEVLIEALNRGETVIDCEQCEIIGSANMAMMSGEITKEEADWIRNYYGYGGMFNGNTSN